MLLTQPRVGGMGTDEQEGQGTAQRWAGEGATSEVTQQAPALNVLAMGTPTVTSGSRVAPVVFLTLTIF